MQLRIMGDWFCCYGDIGPCFAATMHYDSLSDKPVRSRFFSCAPGCRLSISIIYLGVRSRTMKPIAIAQHHADDGANYFATFLERAGLPYQVFHPYLGEALPQDISRFAGYCILGGPMSANDNLDYLKTEMKLALDAMAAEIPVIGHCLGGQLMAKALGGTVQAAENPEIGWVDLQIAVEGAHWFGGRTQARLLQWHGESFSIPRDGKRIMTGAYCANQAFQVGKHLGMQFHCEVDAGKVLTWLKNDRQELVNASHSPGVQDADELVATLDAEIAQSQRVADDIYGEWIKGLKA